MSKAIIRLDNVITKFGDKRVLDGISLEIYEGEIYGLVGGSGTGKSTILKQILMLLTPTSGQIDVLGQDVTQPTHEAAHYLRCQWGVLFQFGALFSSLTVADNIALMLKQNTDLSAELIAQIVQVKISMVGLPDHAGQLYPAELSGGMVKRAALARALVMDPKLLFLDEPTSGLDPVGAQDFDNLILKLRDMLGITVVMVTHDLDTIMTIVDRFALLGNKKIVAQGTLEQVLQHNDPTVEAFFGGVRGQLRKHNGKQA
jgi:phospholipid/cholesterol/gamma-HCH transport system ATP-binding protein